MDNGAVALENGLSRLCVYICASIVICNNNNQGKGIHKFERELGAWRGWKEGTLEGKKREELM